MLLKPRNLITSSTDVIIYGSGYYLSTLSECCSVKSSETCGVRCYSATKAHKKSYAIVCEHYCVAIKFFLLLRLKEKKPNNPIWTIFLHFYFKWEIYESVIFSLHVSQTEDTLWKSALACWCAPYNLKVNEVCPFWAFCCIVPMEIVSGAFSVSILFMNLCRQKDVHRKRNLF